MTSYNPPTAENWLNSYTHEFQEIFRQFYDLGYFDARAGRASLEDFEMKDSELDFWYSEGIFDWENRE